MVLHGLPLMTIELILRITCQNLEKEKPLLGWREIPYKWKPIK